MSGLWSPDNSRTPPELPSINNQGQHWNQRSYQEGYLDQMGLNSRNSQARQNQGGSESQEGNLSGSYNGQNQQQWSHLQNQAFQSSEGNVNAASGEEQQWTKNQYNQQNYLSPQKQFGQVYTMNNPNYQGSNEDVQQYGYQSGQQGQRLGSSLGSHFATVPEQFNRKVMQNKRQPVHVCIKKILQTHDTIYTFFSILQIK